MEPTPPSATVSEIAAPPFAKRLGAALVAAMVLIVVLAFVDREGRAQLETARDLGPVIQSR